METVVIHRNVDKVARTVEKYGQVWFHVKQCRKGSRGTCEQWQGPSRKKDFVPCTRLCDSVAHGRRQVGDACQEEEDIRDWESRRRGLGRGGPRGNLFHRKVLATGESRNRIAGGLPNAWPESRALKWEYQKLPIIWKL